MYRRSDPRHPSWEKVDTGVVLIPVKFPPSDDFARQSSEVAGRIIAYWRAQRYQRDQPKKLETPSGLEHLVI